MREQQLRELGTLARCYENLHNGVSGFCGIMNGEVHLLQDVFLENFDINKCKLIKGDELHNTELRIDWNNATYFCLYEEEE